ncbi:uncharacterized protein RSE6_00372 [Rhynchosporium secalis]|uniref:Uncharacterized protein n=1 Tax=Rhynchosporium secalis TaxID=38038 RepID=A0A1E1LV25_RHYSE|nr:uncharacterized protein RSE6_00372 [Rhynchosporium secalis]
MLIKNLLRLLALVAGAIMVVIAADTGPDPITSTRVFSIAPDDTLSSAPGGEFVTTVFNDHAPTAALTMASLVLPTSTVTRTNTIRSTMTVLGAVNTVTVQLSSVIEKPTLVAGRCYWGVAGNSFPCTWTAGNLPTNIFPTGAAAANITQIHGIGINPSSSTSFAFSVRSNPFESIVHGIKRLVARQGFRGGDSIAASHKMISNPRGNGTGIVATSHHSAGIPTITNPFKSVIQGVKRLVARQGFGGGDSIVAWNKMISNPMGNGSGIVATTHHSAAVSDRHNPFKYFIDSVKSVAKREALDPVRVDWSKVDNSTLTNTSTLEFHSYRGMHRVKWAKCDHVPVVYSPLIISILYIAHAGFLKYQWNTPSRNQSNNGRQVIVFIAIWGAIFPLFVYIEIYISIASAWRHCVPDPSRVYPY